MSWPLLICVSVLHDSFYFWDDNFSYFGGHGLANALLLNFISAVGIVLALYFLGARPVHKLKVRFHTSDLLRRQSIKQHMNSPFNSEALAKRFVNGDSNPQAAANLWGFEAGDSVPKGRYAIFHRAANLLKALLTNGSDNQAFIGAKWLVVLLHVTPRFLKRNVALRILAISPHYFYRTFRAEYQGMPMNQFLEAEFERNRSSRERIVNQILVKHLKPDDQILEIGCGPGFLAKAVASHVKTVYACDISSGVLECSRIINGAPNIRYILSNESGFVQMADASLDLAYSFAVIQHLRESVIKSLFKVAAKKLRSGGLGFFQIQLDDGKWKQESAWIEDQSLTGRLRLKYALNFFPRSEEFFKELAADAGFSVMAFRPMSELLDQPFDDIYHQHLLILSKL
jgi:SAM-dependent methyltransferase